MSNTITAYFKGRIGVAEAVYQNDYGIVMAFDSIDLPAHFECFFSKLNQEEAVPGLGADSRVAIPNSVLADPGNVTIHIPLHTGEDDSEVEYVVYFKVIGRARPIDDGTPTQMTAIERALALLSQPITNIEEIVNEALAFTGETFEEMQEDLDEWKTDTEEGLETWKGGVESDFDNLDAQFQTAVAAVTTDTEVTNIRVGDDNVTYTTAGEAVRNQFATVKGNVNAIYPIQLDPGTMTRKKAVGRSGDLIDANNSGASDYIEVIPGNRLHIDNVLIAGSRAICGYGDDYYFVSCMYTASDATQVEFVVPGNIKYIRVTSPIDTKPTLRYVHIIDDLRNVANIDRWNMLDYIAVQEEKVLDTDGSLINSSDYYTATCVPVEPNKSYITYSESSDTLYTARRLRYLDEDYEQIGDVVNLPSKFTTPALAKYIDLSYHYKTSATHERFADYLADADTNYVNQLNLNGSKILKEDVLGLEEDNLNENVYYPYLPYRRPLIAFIFDGEYNMNDDFKALFDTHNKKCGYALPYTTPFSHLPMLEYLRWQSSGFEILAHSAVAVGTQGTATDEEIIQIVKDSYSTLHDYGFDVHGFVALQGNAKPIAIQTAQKVFDYAATQLNHSGSYGSIDPALTETNIYFNTDAPYYLWRYSMQTSTLQQMKDGVDKCATTNGLLLFYGHANSSDLQNMTLENIDALLSYIEAKAIPVVTPKEAIGNYYSIRYQDVVTN